MWESVKGWLNTQGIGLLDAALKIVLILTVGTVLIRVVMGILNRALARSKMEKAAYSLIKTLAKSALYILLALCLAGSLGIDITGVVALASVVTLAVSLAVQNMLTNIVGGFTLLYTHPFKSGDYVEIASQSGTVKEIGIAYTTLLTPDSKVILIPNSAVVAAEIVNYSVTGLRRASIDVTASYDTPAQKVIDALLEAAREPAVLTDPDKEAAAVLTGYGESAVSYTLRFWTKSEDYWNTVYTVNRKIKVIFDQNGVQMTYPHLNVHLEK